jgi:hypothetical protein
MPVKENVLTRTDDFIEWFLPKIENFRGITNSYSETGWWRYSSMCWRT